MVESRRNRLIRGLLVAGGVTLLLLLLWNNQIFRRFQLSLSNNYFSSAPTSNNIVIIALDDATQAELGRSQTNWRRNVYADLLAFLDEAKTRVVSFDLIFSEPAEGDEAFAQAIASARSSENRTRVIVAAAGVGSPLLTTDPQDYDRVLQYQQGLLPVEGIRNAAENLGYVNAILDIDSSLRRQPSIVQVAEQQGISFSLATYYAFLRIPTAAIPQLLLYESDKILQITPERKLEVDEYGFWLQNFFGGPSVASRQTFPVYSLISVLNGEVDPSVFEDKIVMVGLMNLTGVTEVSADRYAVPSADRGGLMFGVEIQANAVESLIQDMTLKEMPDRQQVLLIIDLVFVCSLLYVFPNWYWKLLIAIVMIVLFTLAALVHFQANRIISPIFYPSLAILLPMLVIIGLDISMERRLRQQAIFLLDSLVDVSEQQLQIEQILKNVGIAIDKILPDSQGGIFDL